MFWTDGTNPGFEGSSGVWEMEGGMNMSKLTLIASMLLALDKLTLDNEADRSAIGTSGGNYYIVRLL